MPSLESLQSADRHRLDEPTLHETFQLYKLFAKLQCSLLDQTILNVPMERRGAWCNEGSPTHSCHKDLALQAPGDWIRIISF